MTILAAKTTKDIWHKGKNGNIYQLDSVVSQLTIEKKLLEDGHNISYIDSTGREGEAKELIDSVHSKNYLNIFTDEHVGDFYLPNAYLVQPSLYPVALEHALIAKDLVDLALVENKSFSTVGGGHHCQYDMPLGFGFVNTMAISATYAASLGHKVALLDLDTHYSNGCNDLLRRKPNILMCSLWNQVIPAWKYYEAQDNLVHEKVSDTVDYFDKLNRMLEKIKMFNPSLFIYHLGFDVLETDRMGGVPGMTKENLLKREKIVKEFLDNQNIPYIIYRGGGYTKYDGDAQTIQVRKNALLDTQISGFNNYF